MPIRPEYRWFYPIDWPQLSAVIRFRRLRFLRPVLESVLATAAVSEEHGLEETTPVSAHPCSGNLSASHASTSSGWKPNGPGAPL